MSNKGSRKPNYTTTSPPTSWSPRVSTSAHTKDLVIIAKRKSNRNTDTKRECKLETKIIFFNILKSKQFIKQIINKQFSKHIRHVKANNARPSNSVIRIHMKRSNSVDTCTCGGLYYSTEPLPMGFTLSCTRLAFNHLRPLSYQRLRPLATLTIWISTL